MSMIDDRVFVRIMLLCRWSKVHVGECVHPACGKHCKRFDREHAMLLRGHRKRAPGETFATCIEP